MAKKIELLHTTYDESGNIESQEVVHPLTSPDCIIMENGKTLDEVMGDGIATPTLTHEGTSFKVGVGDSNIEVVDGDVAGMTLKGQSYQNILPKPTTLIMETDEQEFKINDKIDSNIIIDDNIAEIATVKGKTIVNAVQEESGSEYIVLGEDLSGQSIVTTEKAEGNVKGVTLQGQTLVNYIQEPCEDAYTIDNNLVYDVVIKPSTLYTIRFKHDTVNTDNPLTVNLGGTELEVSTTEFTITTPETLVDNTLVFSGKNNVVSEVQVIEGDVTNIEYPFFEGMNDVKFSDSKFIGRGKNLTSLNIMYDNFTKTVSGENRTVFEDGVLHLRWNGNPRNATLVQDIFKPKQQYTFSFWCKAPEGYTWQRHMIKIHYTDGTLSALPASHTSDTDYTQQIITSEYGKTIERIGVDLNNQLSINQVQIEEGSIATSYEPYKGVEVQQDVDSIPLTSDMFEQGNINAGDKSVTVGMSYQQFPQSGTNTDRIKSKTIIPVKPNAKYTINFQGYVIMFDRNGDHVKVGSQPTLDFTSGVEFIIPSNVHYIALCMKNSDNANITPSDLDSMNLILQEVPQEIVLRGIGDVKDELDLTRGEYIQRIGEVVLDANDAVAYRDPCHGVGKSTFQVHFIYMDLPKTLRDDKILFTGSFIQENLGSKHNDKTLIKYENNYIHNYTDGTYKVNRIYMSLNKETFGSSSADDYNTAMTKFKEWITVNPVTVQYKLATPIIHKVNLTNTKVIQSYSTETHYETITPSDSLIPNITIPSTLNYDVAIKPSTEYTIRANTSDNLTVDLGGTTGTLSNGKVTLTTPATLAHNEVKFSGTGSVKELMVVEGSEIKDNVPFFNGMKDVQMGGIKLVNIARGATCNELVTANTNKTQFTYTGDGSSWGHIVFDESLLKRGVVYTLFMKVITNQSDNATPIKIQIGSSTEKTMNVLNGFTGMYSQVQRTPTKFEIGEDIKRFTVSFRPCTSGQQVVIQNPMVIEGDWTHLDEIPYIESEMIIEQPIIRSQGKNLFDVKAFADKVLSLSSTHSLNGNIITFNPYYLHGHKLITDFKPNTQYALTWNVTHSETSKNFILRFYYTDGTVSYINYNPSNSSDIGVKKKLTLVSNSNKTIEYFGIDYGYSTTVMVDLSEIQLEEGSTTTSYEPYKHQTLYSNRVIGYEENCHHDYRNGSKVSNVGYNSVISDVEGLSIAYVTNVSSNITFFDKDGVFISGKAFLDTSLNMGDKNGFVTVPTNAKYMRFASHNDTAHTTDYTKATVTGDLPLRSLPNGVCDTLNLVTGEYVQRVGEVVLDGSQSITIYSREESMVFTKTIAFNISVPNTSTSVNLNLHCTSIPVDSIYSKDSEGIFNKDSTFRVSINKDKLITQTIDGFKQYLSENPITVQYELATPIVRKLGFTTKGNYTQANLATDCSWLAAPTTTNNTLTTRYSTANHTLLPIVYNTHLFSDDFPIRYFNVDGHGDYEYISNMEYRQYINVRRDKLEADTVEAFSKWLSQNPIEVGYITREQSSESYSNIHKPIFFNNVNVQYLPHNLDIQPELTYQVRTRNSYVLDMAKSNTKYTIKALSNPHNFYINGKLYDKGTNGMITTPTLTNKLMIVGSSDVKELMMIEGDVTGKNLPYFKGILSSYHDVDEINITSSNDEYSNTTLLPMPTRLETVKVVRPEMEEGAINTDTGANYDDGDSLVRNVRTKDYLPVQPGEIIKFYNDGQGRAVNIHYYDINKQFVKYEFYDGTSTRPTVPKDCYFVRMYCGKSACSDITLTRQVYKPIQLNSSPNGVRDEIIMKPNSNKAQLVQRVGKVVLDGSEEYWGLNELWSRDETDYCCFYNSEIAKNIIKVLISDKLIAKSANELRDYATNLAIGEGIRNDINNIQIFLTKSKLSGIDVNGLKAYLQQNPITIYYELTTPIIHEIQLKGYPHVYEDGTVTLNTDTPHQTLVSYNVNQEQLIYNQNETIIRHDQQIDDLYYYIELYLEEIYQMELFRMKLELSL